MHPKTDNLTKWIGFATLKLAGSNPIQRFMSGLTGISSQNFFAHQRLSELIIEPVIFPAVGEHALLCVRRD